MKYFDYSGRNRIELTILCPTTKPPIIGSNQTIPSPSRTDLPSPTKTDLPLPTKNQSPSLF